MGKAISRERRSKDKVDIKALSKTTPFTQQQLKLWYEEFLKDCPGGLMTKDIFMENYRDFFFPSDLNMKKLADYIFNRFDENKDGVITFSEFIQAVTIPATGTLDEKLDWAFSIYDVDDDGYVTQDEMLEIVKAVYKRKGLSADQLTFAQSKVQTIFMQMDSNSDGKLSKQEFIEGFKRDPTILKSLLAKQDDS